MNCLKVSIHAPGRGSTFTAPGKIERRRYGVESPIAITVKMRNDCAVESASAAPSAGARNGAEQGVATTVARIPVKKEPASPDFICSSPPTAVAARPNSNTPLMFSAKTSIPAARANTKAGDCSWNPHPSCSPLARSAASTPASVQNESKTPPVNTRPCATTLPRSPPAWFTKPRILIPSTGNTHGIRFRIIPPTNASSSVPPRPAGWEGVRPAPLTPATGVNGEA
jgi:hypothetical protein